MARPLTFADTVAALRRLGDRVRIEGNRIRVRGRVDPALQQAIRAHRQDILRNRPEKPAERQGPVQAMPVTDRPQTRTLGPTWGCAGRSKAPVIVREPRGWFRLTAAEAERLRNG